MIEKKIVLSCPFCKTENVLKLEKTYIWGDARSYTCSKCGYFTITRNKTLHEGFRQIPPSEYIRSGMRGLRVYGKNELLKLGVM